MHLQAWYEKRTNNQQIVQQQNISDLSQLILYLLYTCPWSMFKHY